ncbi:MAG: hypothetical protein AAGA96_09985 [Verrucomicrobiota bacterium]
MIPRLFLILLLTFSVLHRGEANPVVYKAEGEGRKDLHLVLIASDHEYRSEETIPALARILTKHHGFDCTVLFGLVPDDGTILGGQSNIPGMEALDDADGMVFFARFLALPDEQMKPFDAYLKRGGPVVALRTSTHAFRYPKDSESPYRIYDYKYEGEEFVNGFGHQIQGQTWVGHYGKNHQQFTRITKIPEKEGHPILSGVSEIWAYSGGYNAEPADDWEILTMAQPLMTFSPDGEPDETKPPKASEWTRLYQVPGGVEGRCFTSLYGSSEDILSEGYRRMLINGVYWSLGLESEIDPNSNIGFVGPFRPNPYGNGSGAKGILPSAYEGFESPIPAHNDVPKNKRRTPSPQ